MNQAQLQRLAEDRLLDAAALLDGQRWSFAYYVAGYAVECALKSCTLARMIQTGWLFDEQNRNKKIGDFMSHDLSHLIGLAGMKDVLDVERKTSAASGGEFATFWGRVEQWDVASRYSFKSESEARQLYEAITDPLYGVMQWLRKYW